MQKPSNNRIQQASLNVSLNRIEKCCSNPVNTEKHKEHTCWIQLCRHAVLLVTRRVKLDAYIVYVPAHAPDETYMNLTTFLYTGKAKIVFIYIGASIYIGDQQQCSVLCAERMPHVRINTHRSLLSAISVLISQWLQRLTGDQKLKLRIRLPSGTKNHFPEFAIKLE